jgi:hypothetical protein
MLRRADRSFGSNGGKFKRGSAQEPVLGKVHHQEKRQNKQQRVLNGNLHPLPGLTFFLPEIYLKYMHNFCQEIN